MAQRIWSQQIYKTLNISLHIIQISSIIVIISHVIAAVYDIAATGHYTKDSVVKCFTVAGHYITTLKKTSSIIISFNDKSF